MQPNQNGGDGQKPKQPRPIMDMYPAHKASQTSDQRPLKPLLGPQLSVRHPKALPKPPLVHQALPTNEPKVRPQAAQLPGKKPNQDIERPSALFITSFLLILLLVSALAAGTYYYFAKYKPNHKHVAVVSKKAADNTNHITDDTLGLKFAITKDLTAMTTADLAKENPSFVYGFKQADVPNVACIISQQKRNPPGGAVIPESLRDGTLKGVKKSFPDAKLMDYQDISLANGQDAASLVLTYTDNKVALTEKIIVAATNNKVTFAFCTSPTPLYSFYDTKFEPFFNSLEVY